MKRTINRLLLGTALCTASLIWAGNAFAQTSNAEAGEGDEIIVTAQRREQRLQEAPVAVTALNEGALDQLNVSKSSDLMQVVPGLQVSTQTAGDGGGSATFFLRGMGQQRSGNGSEPAVGIYVDDFYYPSLAGNIFDIVDLEQVEVLRGPQGTLFGRNTIGGAVRYTTRGPKLGEFSGHVTGTYGSRDRTDISGAVNLPIGDFGAIRLSGGHLQQDGFVRITSTGKLAGDTQTDLVRAQARFEPTSNLSIDLSAQYSKFKLDGFTYNVPGPLTPVPAPTLPFIWNSVIAPLIGAGAPLYTDAFRSTCYYCQFGTGSPEFSDTRYKNALATVKWELGSGFTLKSLTGWQDVRNRASADFDSSPIPIYDAGITNIVDRAFSQELQLNGELLDDRLNFVAGGYYYNQRSADKLPDTPNVVLGGPISPTLSDRNVKTYAGFVDGSFKLSEKLSLLGGFRYSEDHKELFVFTDTGAPITDRAAVFDSTTYRMGLQYQWRSDIMTYLNASSGFRGGGFNPYDPFDPLNIVIRPFDPEKAVSYEAGARLQFLDRRVTINPTVFYVDWSKIQVQSVSINPNSGNAEIKLENAGKARSYGAEIEWSAAVTDQLRLFGNLAYLDIRYTDIGNASGITLQSPLQRAPEITFALGASHSFDLTSGARIMSTLNYSFQDEQASTPTDSDNLMLKAYGLLNGRIEFMDADRRFSVAGYARNILDKKYAIGGVNYYSNAGGARFDLGSPREIGVTARVNF